ncbi:MAG: UDP-N-acetylmuramoyl-tripeptide--D-alanyl-D-alanine ligase [Thermotogaceae bacterium]|jgi:UDP-N-acetylmuramoyl-tripeptide--D-alanyl-D-alanine ligase|nr:UDP-N-acetylmuramoyl-tripeptide--D-alanyl-D-alanine ligase [Thermotogaceae bacterium]
MVNIRQFLDLLKDNGEFEIEKLTLFFENRCSLEDTLFFTSDSRKVKNNSIFVAIKGKRVDGHDYVNQSFQNGALVAIVEDSNAYEGLCIKVDSVVQFLNNLASILYSKYAGYTIAVTGSNGKTTTKEWIKKLLSLFLTKQSIFANRGNMNTEIGLPLCILNEMDERKQLSVIEMGMSKKGDIEYLVDTYKPNYPVILNIGTAHIGNTGSLENTFHEKIKLLKYHSFEEPLCLNCSDSFLKKFLEKNKSKKTILFGYFKDKKVGFTGVYLKQHQHCIQNHEFFTDVKLILTQQKKETEIEARLQGFFHQGQLLNLCAALAVVSSLGYEVSQITNLSAFVRPVKDRFEPVFVGNHLFIKDCYNFSLESLSYALDLLKNLKTKNSFKRTYCVLGSIAEAGSFDSEIYDKVGILLNENQIDVVLLYTKDPGIKGIQRTYKGTILIFDNISLLSKEINHQKQAENKSIFLFKASRSIQLEEVFDHVMDVIN